MGLRRRGIVGGGGLVLLRTARPGRGRTAFVAFLRRRAYCKRKKKHGCGGDPSRKNRFAGSNSVHIVLVVHWVKYTPRYERRMRFGTGSLSVVPNRIYFDLTKQII